MRYALLRLLGAIPTLLLVIVLAFLMVHAAPGGPFDDERSPHPDVVANIEATYHLDEPLPQQFGRYLFGLIRGDLGPSFRYSDYSVAELIGLGFPVSLKLGALAMLLAMLIGVSAGSFAALRQGSLTDRVVMAFAMTGISIPVFVVAPVLVLLLAVKLHWLPAGWSASPGAAKYILPIVTLALPQIAYIARLTRASMIDVLSRDFIRTARAQGLGTSTILRVHALKPAMLPVLSYTGPAIAAILTGSVVVEQVFGIPGLGASFVQGALNRDYTLVLGIVIFYATLIIALNLLVDVLYSVIDPRYASNEVERWFVTFILLLAIVGPWISPYTFEQTNFDAILRSPGFAEAHYFGTDEFGRDLFVRTLLGIRITLLVAIVASLVSLIIGVSYGAIAGYVGGRVDAVMMRFVDTLYALPFIFFVILLMVAFERNFLLIFIAIGAINWLDMARIVRGQTLSLREREFVDAARLTGVSAARIIFRHIAPNLIGIVVVYVTLTIPQAILVESFLSFLGLGVQEPQTSLGSLVNGGVKQMEGAPWMLLIPATLLATMLMCFNFLGDALRDFFDARHSS